MGPNAIWITWENQTRNHSMCKQLDVPLHELISSRSGIFRYIELIFRTFHLVQQKKPTIIFCQNPSLILALFCTIFLRAKNRKIIVDEHNAGLFPYEGASVILTTLANYIIKKADLLIVTNIQLSDYCEKMGGKSVVMPDPLPDLPSHKKPPRPAYPLKILFVCSWSEDEPFHEVFRACRVFSKEEIKVLVTGNPRDISQKEIPPSIELTGFLTKEKYFEHLQDSDAVMVFTKRENCLNCGAYEAVSACKPGILSNKQAIKDYFNEGFLYADNTADDIQKKIIELKEKIRPLTLKIPYLKRELEYQNNQLINQLKEKIQALP